MHAAHGSVLAVDAQRRVTLLNPAAERLAGIAAGSVRGTTSGAVCFDAILDAIVEYMGSASESLVWVNRKALRVGWNFMSGRTSTPPLRHPRFAVNPAWFHDGPVC
jgi:hypothetical protein